MGKFKDRLDSLGNGEKLADEKLAEKCEPGRTINFKTGEPATTPSPPGGPPSPPTIDTGEICDCFSTKIDELIDDVRNTYPYGASFNTGKLFTQAATPIEIDAAITSQSLDPDIKGFYDAIPVATKRNNLNARQIWVIADPDNPLGLPNVPNPNDPFLYVKYSHGPSAEYSVEVPVRVGEDWEFRDVYEFRIRASVEGQQYRITTDPHHTTFVSTIVNIPPVSGAVINAVTVLSGSVVSISGQTIVTNGNRPNFIAQNISGIALVDQVIPFNIPIPNGFALSLKANKNNIGDIFISRTNATNSLQRVTLAPEDEIQLYITNANLIHVASTLSSGQTIDLLVEQ